MASGHQHQAGAHGHGHSHGPGHGHGLAHGHDHGPVDYGRSFVIGIVLNAGFCLLEAGYGIASGSMALLADAGHNLSDVLGLLVGWTAVILGRRAPSRRFTYGMKRASVLAALTNAVLLLVATGAIAFEAIRRLGAPSPIETGPMIWVALIGIAINGATAWLFARGKADLNAHAAFLHMVADALVSAGVVVTGIVIARTGWVMLDPIVSLAIAVIIVLGTWRLLRDSVALSLDAVPDGVDPEAIEQALATLPGVTGVHHIHVWPISTTETAFTGHLLVEQKADQTQILRTAALMLTRDFAVAHTTIQIEHGDCVEAHDHHH